MGNPSLFGSPSPLTSGSGRKNDVASVNAQRTASGHPRQGLRIAWKWWHIANYASRALLIAVGLFLSLAPLPVPEDSTLFLRVFGIVMALFGLYRLVWYHWRLQQWKQDEEELP